MTANPTYGDVCSGTSGHAEAVRVEFDPSRISYSDLLGRFWQMHDYTRRQRQSERDQYRNAIFFLDGEQREQAETSKLALEETRRSARPVTTFIQPAGVFWPAEECHQRYYEKRGFSSCRFG